MRSILVTSHKGGVGKTFASVHLATIWAYVERRRVLLVDCDGQYDSYEFLKREKPTVSGEKGITKVTEDFVVIPNYECKSLKTIGVGEEEYDFVIIDSDARLADAVKTILQNRISMVLTPLRDSLSVTNFKQLIQVVRSLYGLQGDARQSNKQGRDIVADRVMLLPLGTDMGFLQQKLLAVRLWTRLNKHQRMKHMPRETDLSLREGIPLWELEHLPDEERVSAKNYFYDLAKNIEKFLARKEMTSNG